MASIKIDSWTKNKVDEILAKEGHSSHDSVIKTLLNTHRMIQKLESPQGYQPVTQGEQIRINSYIHNQEKITDYYDGAGQKTIPTNGGEAIEQPGLHSDRADEIQKSIPGLTAFAEKTNPSNDLQEIDLLCPNCASKVISLSTHDPTDVTLEELNCPGCGIDAHNDFTLVTLEGNSPGEEEYPARRQRDTESFRNDLKQSVLDYWNRYFEKKYYSLDLSFTPRDEEIAEDLYRVARTAGWSWRPPDLPVQHLSHEHFYKNTSNNTYLQLIDPIEHGKDTVLAMKWPVGDDPFDAEPEEITPQGLRELVQKDELVRTFEVEDEWEVLNVIRLMTQKDDEPITIDRIVERARQRGVPPERTRECLEDLERPEN